MTDVQTFDNGLRVVSRIMPHASSVTICFFVRTGAIYERGRQKGLSHFIEHMLFKGTKNRTTADISKAIDGVGGQMNAYTAKELTCFHVRVLRENLALAMDILCDMLWNSSLNPEDIEREKSVVLEEISMVADTPDDVVHEMLNAAFFHGHPLATPILGTPRTVRGFTREDIVDYMNLHYTPSNMVVSVAGDFSPPELNALCEKYLAHRPACQHRLRTRPHVYAPPGSPLVCPKPIEQVHVCLGYPGLAYGTDTYPLLVLNNILGGGMSGWLFQTIREERGLAYSVFSYPSFFCRGGLYTLYAGTNRENAPECVRLMLEQVKKMAQGDFTQDEFQCAWQQMKGTYLLGQDSTAGHAQSIGRNLLLLNRLFEEKNILRRMHAVTPDGVRNLAAELLTKTPYLAAVGQVDDVGVQGWMNT